MNLNLQNQFFEKSDWRQWVFSSCDGNDWRMGLVFSGCWSSLFNSSRNNRIEVAGQMQLLLIGTNRVRYEKHRSHDDSTGAPAQTVVLILSKLNFLRLCGVFKDTSAAILIGFSCTHPFKTFYLWKKHRLQNFCINILNY